tara:strand:- start:24 stop:548 length:525 start_codon:yes stop_codon:yes gene_type:complete
MKIITKKYKVFDIADLKKDDELCDNIYRKFWLESEDNINPWADENLESFKTFADCLDFGFDYSLSYGEYSDRGCYIKLTPNYDLDNKDYKNLLQDYKGNGYYLCEHLKKFTLKLLAKKEYKVLCENNINDFVEEIQNEMFDLWFKDNKDYFSKKTFLESVELNDYEFTAEGVLM